MNQLNFPAEETGAGKCGLKALWSHDEHFPLGSLDGYSSFPPSFSSFSSSSPLLLLLTDPVFESQGNCGFAWCQRSACIWPQVHTKSSLGSNVGACALLMSIQNDFLFFFFLLPVFLVSLSIIFKIIKQNSGNSLAVQWLGLCAFTATILSSIPSQGTKIPQVTEWAKTMNPIPSKELGKPKDVWKRTVHPSQENSSELYSPRPTVKNTFYKWL